VDHDQDTVAGGLRRDQLHRLLLARLAEHLASCAEEDRVDHLARLVDEVVLEQGLDQAAAAVDQDVPGYLVVNVASPPRKMRRRPKRSVARPPSISRPPVKSTYELASVGGLSW
jgi:hypothetical protein